MVREGGPWTRSRWWSMDWGSVLCIYPVEVYYTCILLLYFTTEVYFDEYTSVILLLKSMIDLYFNHTTVTRSITEVYLLYT